MEYSKKYPPKFITKAGLERSILNIQEYDKPFIGFARRFAEYKRADLIFHDIDRLSGLLEKYGFILLISGKAHPADIEGQAALKNVISSVSKKELQSRVIFLEDYDMNTGKQLTSACDLWLNTPLRPKEACGTSGMKSAINGGLNLSILDGWWDEAYTGDNGFAFGGDKEYNNIEDSYEQAEELYSEIEQALDIYSNHKAKWYSMVRESIISTGTSFSSVKMLLEYNKLYVKNARGS